eukprot:scaffold4300_cov81-Isochrysis_galbana.AAC.4
MPSGHFCGGIVERDHQQRRQHACGRGVPQVAGEKAAAVGGSVSQDDGARPAWAAAAVQGGGAGGGLRSEGKEVGRVLRLLDRVWLAVCGGDGRALGPCSLRL